MTPSPSARSPLPRLAACAALASLPLLTPADAQGLTRTIDGTGNNLANPTWGSAGIPLLRKATAEYADGLGAPAGFERPSARAISNGCSAQAGPMPNPDLASDYLWQWGQFLDHDIDLTGPASPIETFDIDVPQGDPWFDPNGTGVEQIPLDRSLYAVDGAAVRQQVNQITAFIDGSNVYGSDQARALELRTLDGTGRLKTTPSAFGPLLPYNVNGFPNAPVATDPSLFIAGDVRANEQNGLTAMHTLFVREHNFLATAVGALFPNTSGEDRYQVARALVGAEIQRITYEEYLPTLLGPNALAPYTGYEPSVDPGIANLFSTACFRYGHSQLNTQLMRMGSDGNPIPAGHLALKDAFFNPSEIEQNGIDPLLRGLAMQVAQRIDTLVVDDVRNFLFGPPGSGGFDLASLNIQRGRDHGLPDYKQARLDYGLPPVTSWSDITSDPVAQEKLFAAYTWVQEVDAWVGGLAEDPVPGGMVGPLIRAVLVDQFERLRDGDRYWWQNAKIPLYFYPWLSQQTLATVIRRNTGIGSELPDNVFKVAGA